MTVALCRSILPVASVNSSLSFPRGSHPFPGSPNQGSVVDAPNLVNDSEVGGG